MPVQYLKGAGPKRAELLQHLGVETVEDLLHLYPRDYIDRSRLAPIASLRIGEIATVIGRVRSATVRPVRGRRDFRLTLEDATGRIECVWFNQPYLEGILERGQSLVVSGQVALFRTLQLKNAVFELLSGEEQDLIHTGRIVPTYPLTAGLSAKIVRGLMKSALDRYADLAPESLPEWLRSAHELVPLPQALREIHFPSSVESRDEARRRLASRSSSSSKSSSAGRRRASRRPNSVTRSAIGAVSRRSAPRCRSRLTGSQEGALGEILEDLAGRCR